MTEYWKSNPRYFCEICKCWLAGNKPSIDFHEGGRRHKANVEKQLKQARFRSTENEKEQAKTDHTLAAIEQAALQAYQRDLAVQFGEASVGKADVKMIALREKYGGEIDITGHGRAEAAPQEEQETSKIKDEIQANVQKKLEELQRQKQAVAAQQAAAQCPWQLLYSPEGYPYYYNSTTGATQWEVPPEFQKLYGSVGSVETPVQPTVTTSEATEQQTSTESAQETTSNSSTKRSAEEADVESRETHQPIKRRPGGAYGGWSTVAVYEKVEEEEQASNEGGEKEEEDEDDSSEDGDGDREDRPKFEEKTVSSLGQSEREPTAVLGGGFKGFGFKKRAGNRPQIRQLKANDV